MVGIGIYYAYLFFKLCDFLALFYDIILIRSSFFKFFITFYINKIYIFNYILKLFNNNYCIAPKKEFIPFLSADF